MTSLQRNEREARMASNRENDIILFLKDTKSIIEYNGASYFIIRGQEVLGSFDSPEEIHSFVLGWIYSNSESSSEIEDLKKANTQINKQNDTNIELYEKLIADMNERFEVSPICHAPVNSSDYEGLGYV